MPNWCNNWAEIEGPVEKIKALHEAGKDEKFLEHMAPIGNWDYNDAVSNWGTKWDIDIGNLTYEQDGKRATIKGYFESAWSPPDQAFETYLLNNHDVNMQLMWFEPAMDFVGCLEHGTVTLSDEPREFWTDTDTGRELDECFGILDSVDEHMAEVMEEVVNTDPTTLMDPEYDKQTKETN